MFSRYRYIVSGNEGVQGRTCGSRPDTSVYTKYTTDGAAVKSEVAEKVNMASSRIYSGCSCEKPTSSSTMSYDTINQSGYIDVWWSGDQADVDNEVLNLLQRNKICNVKAVRAFLIEMSKKEHRERIVDVTRRSEVQGKIEELQRYLEGGSSKFGAKV